MRGTPPWSPRSRGRAGIIPAYAGNTSSGQVLDLTYRDHPRVCGEHLEPSPVQNSTAGSSPRMRGTPVSLSSIVNTRGIIPAYAGNTLAAQSSKSSTGDHPRVCGEHLSAMSFVVFIGGSSPRMRGTLSTVNWSIRDRGIIPAYAGNTAIFPTSAFIIRDHPRVCGEHMTSAAMGNEAAGSSPRMRGTPFAPPTPVDTTGIIPAYAGNTQQASGLVERRRGSSPRMRGTRPRSAIRTRTCGIIPAYAGNTQSTAVVDCHKGDHPRVCGEHSKVVSMVRMEPGSSPRMRGTLGRARVLASP